MMLPLLASTMLRGYQRSPMQIGHSDYDTLACIVNKYVPCRPRQFHKLGSCLRP
eukprot:SAG11_NODE_794_length_7137_cov_45.288576_8_plen_54_part_00